MGKGSQVREPRPRLQALTGIAARISRIQVRTCRQSTARQRLIPTSISGSLGTMLIAPSYSRAWPACKQAQTLADDHPVATKRTIEIVRAMAVLLCCFMPALPGGGGLHLYNPAVPNRCARVGPQSIAVVRIIRAMSHCLRS